MFVIMYQGLAESAGEVSCPICLRRSHGMRGTDSRVGAAGCGLELLHLRDGRCVEVPHTPHTCLFVCLGSERANSGMPLESFDRRVSRCGPPEQGQGLIQHDASGRFLHPSHPRPLRRRHLLNGHLRLATQVHRVGESSLQRRVERGMSPLTPATPTHFTPQTHNLLRDVCCLSVMAVTSAALEMLGGVVAG